MPNECKAGAAVACPVAQPIPVAVPNNGIAWHEQEEDMVSILATVARAVAAGAAADPSQAPAEPYTSRRNPKQFALAEVRKRTTVFSNPFL